MNNTLYISKLSMKSVYGLSFGLFLFFFSTFVIEDRGSAEVISGSVGGVQFVRLVLLVSSLLVYLYSTEGLIYIKRSKSLFFLYVYLMISFISVLWSSSPIATLGKVLELYIAVLYAVIVAENMNSKNGFFIVRFFLISFSFMVVFSTALGIMHVDGFYEISKNGFAQYTGFRVKGIGLSANSIGTISAALLVLIYLDKRCYLVRDTSFRVLLMTLLLFSLLFSGSRTGLALLVFSLLIYYSLSGSFKTRSLLIVIAALFFFYFSVFLSFIIGGQGESEIFTLSGRTVMWEYAFFYFLDNWLIGNGWGVGSRDLFVSIDVGIGHETISSVHNGYFEVLLGLGVVGFIPWFLMIIRISLEYVKYVKYDNGFICFSSMVPLLLGVTIMSPGIGGRGGFYIFILVLTIFSLNNSKYASRTLECQ